MRYIIIIILIISILFLIKDFYIEKENELEEFYQETDQTNNQEIREANAERVEYTLETAANFDRINNDFNVSMGSDSSISNIGKILKFYVRRRDEYFFENLVANNNSDKLDFYTEFSQMAPYFPDSYNEEFHQDYITKYKNGSYYSLSPLFLQYFRPNIILNLYYINNPNEETRIRYQIRDKNDDSKKILYSNYITYEKVEVDADKNPIKSSISGVYEPKQNYLLKKEDNIVSTTYKNTNDKNENNYIKNLHEFLMDMRDYCPDQNNREISPEAVPEIETCPPAPNSSKNLFVTQDINNLIPRNQMTPIVSLQDLNCEVEIGEGGECPASSNNTNNKREMIFNPDCVQSSIKLFMFPGEYAIDFIFDQEFSQDTEFKFCFEMKYNLKNRSEYVVVENHNQKVNYIEGVVESTSVKESGNYIRNSNEKIELNNLIIEYKQKLEETQIEEIKCDANSPDSDTCEFFKIQLFVILEKYLRSFNKEKNISLTGEENNSKLKKSLRYLSSLLIPIGQILYQPAFTERPEQLNLENNQLFNDLSARLITAVEENNYQDIENIRQNIRNEVDRVNSTMPKIRISNRRKAKITSNINNLDDNIEYANEIETNVSNFYEEFSASPPPGISTEEHGYFQTYKKYFLQLIKSNFDNNGDELELDNRISSTLNNPENLIQTTPVDIDSLKMFYQYINDNKVRDTPIRQRTPSSSSDNSNNLSYSILSLIDNYFYIILRNFNIRLTSNTNNFPSISNELIRRMETTLGNDNSVPAPIHTSDRNILFKTINVEIEKKEDNYDIIPGTTISFDSPAFTRREEEEEVDSYTVTVRKTLNSLKNNVNNIIKTKVYNSGDMSLELENSLKSIYEKSNNDLNVYESTIYSNIISFINGLISKISTGRVDYIQNMLGLDVNTYIYDTNTPVESKINEILPETFSNYKVEEEMNTRTNTTNATNTNNTINKPDTIETFSNWHGNKSLHKHTSRGTIDYELSLNLNTQSGRDLIQDQSLISESSKSQLTNSYKNMEQTLLNASNKVDEFIQLIDQKNQTFDYDKLNSDKENIKNIILERRRKNKEENYIKKEADQKLKRESLELKLKELENIQGKKYLGEQNDYNSVKSYDNQEIISVNNLKDDVYNVLVNGKCLEYSKNKRGEVIQINKCTPSNKKQQFRINSIKNYEDYNSKMTTVEVENQATKYDPIKYPFYLLNPVQYSSQCLSLDGNNVGVTECYKTKQQRWEGLKSVKDCK